MANKGSNKPLAAIYGQALYEAAGNAGVQARVADELSGLMQVLHRDSRVAIFLETPTIAFEDKRKVIEGSFSGYTPVMRNLLLVVIEHGRAAMLDQIGDAYTAYANRMANIAVVEVQSARALENDERDGVSKIMQRKLNKTIKLDERVYPDLMGGLVLIYGDKSWDGSLRRRLEDTIKTMVATKTNTIKWTE